MDTTQVPEVTHLDSADSPPAAYEKEIRLKSAMRASKMSMVSAGAGALSGQSVREKLLQVRALK